MTPYQSPNDDARQCSHNQCEHQYRPSLKHCVHDSLSCVSRVLIGHYKHHARCFHHRHVREILECCIFHFTIDWKTKHRSIFPYVILDNFGVVEWIFFVRDVCVTFAALMDDIVQNFFEDAFDVAGFISVDVGWDTPPLCF